MPFRQGDDLDGQITQIMKRGDMRSRIAIGTERGVHNTGVFGHDLVLITAEEMVVEIIDEVVMAESLQAEEDDLVPHADAGHSRRHIGHGFGDPLREHRSMAGLIKITEQQGHGILRHRTSPQFSDENG